MPEEAVPTPQSRAEYEDVFATFIDLPYNSSHVNMSPSPTSSPSRKRSYEDMSQNLLDGQHTASGISQQMSDAAIERPPSGQTGITQLLSTAEIAQQEHDFHSETEPDDEIPQPEPMPQHNHGQEASPPGSQNGEDPGVPIAIYNWEELESQYHEKIDQLNSEEAAIWEEFQELCGFFAHWADTMQTYEVDRSYKRLKTQMTYVQRKEGDLEEKRLKYVQVVNALQSALALLR